MNLKEVFSKSNIIIFLLILAFSVFVVFLLINIYEEDIEEEIKEDVSTESQIQEVQGLKKQVEYSSPMQEEIKRQLDDLKRLREERK